MTDQNIIMIFKLYHDHIDTVKRPALWVTPDESGATGRDIFSNTYLICICRVDELLWKSHNNFS